MLHNFLINRHRFLTNRHWLKYLKFSFQTIMSPCQILCQLVREWCWTCEIMMSICQISMCTSQILCRFVRLYCYHLYGINWKRTFSMIYFLTYGQQINNKIRQMNIISDKWWQNYATIIHFLTFLSCSVTNDVFCLISLCCFKSPSKICRHHCQCSAAKRSCSALTVFEEIFVVYLSCDADWRICGLIRGKKSLFTIRTCFIQVPHLPLKTFYYVVMI